MVAFARPFAFASLLAIVFIALAPVSAARAAPDWKTAMTGVDGIVVYCEATTRQSYALQICEAVGKAVKTGFEGSDLPVTDAGIVYTGSAAKGDADPLATRAAHDHANPLYLRVLIKGTEDNRPAIYVGLSAAIAFQAAKEEGSDLPGKAGDLLLDEQHTVANGPRNKLAGFLANHWSGKAGEMVEAIRSSL